MEFLEKFKASLPETLVFTDLEDLVPSEWWQTKPQRAAQESLRRTGLFDEEAYLQAYPDVAKVNLDPIQHFVLHGLEEGRRWFLKKREQVETKLCLESCSEIAFSKRPEDLYPNLDLPLQRQKDGIDTDVLLQNAMLDLVQHMTKDA